jgi:hypothetical protein
MSQTLNQVTLARHVVVQAVRWIKELDTQIKYKATPVFPMNLWSSPYCFEFDNKNDAMLFRLAWSQYIVRDLQ